MFCQSSAYGLTRLGHSFALGQVGNRDLVWQLGDYARRADRQRYVSERDELDPKARDRRQSHVPRDCGDDRLGVAALCRQSPWLTTTKKF